MSRSIQCRNMVEQQIRTWEVLDDRVLDTYYKMHRDNFVPPNYAALAYSDAQLPIGFNQLTLEPKVEARILQEIAPQQNETILHIGTGTGFFAALLSTLSNKVVTVENIPQLADAARIRFADHGITNVTSITANGLTGDVPGAPFDAIVLTGSVPSIPAVLLKQLRNGGRLVAPIGVAPISCVVRIRSLDNIFPQEDLFDTWVPQLTGVTEQSHFNF